MYPTHNTCLAALIAALLAACAHAPAGPAPSSGSSSAPAPQSPAQLKSGINSQYEDSAVRAQDDFYQHVNGRWLATVEIPPDRSMWGSYMTLRDTITGQLRELVETVGQGGSVTPDERKIGDLYASFMDEARIEESGAMPLAATLAKIDAMKDKREIPAIIAYFNRIGAMAPYLTYVNVDAKDPSQYAAVLQQSGLGLPDRDYYLKDDAKFKEVRAKYEVHIGKMLALSSDRNAKADARSILALETAIAQAQWSKVDNRDPVKTYNKLAVGNLEVLIHGHDWNGYLAAAGLEGKVDSLIVRQPSYLQSLGEIMERTPLPVWKAYFKWALLNDAAPYLSKAFVDEDFAFNGTVLRGVPQDLPRWKRGVALVNASIGEGLGRLYVAQRFPPASKARIEALVGNLLAAYRARIETLDWMSPATKQQAQAKLAKINVKVGYPDRWRDYSKLDVSRDDLYGNVERANEFEYQRDLDKLGGPIDRDEWGMTPQTVNAYYNPPKNEIVFPAAFLQPAAFQPDAEDAVNYGGIGAIIGHEISHGFDDQGSQFDADGKLRNWWTPQDREKYTAATSAMAAEYEAFEPVPGFHLNGKLTLGENIADNAGLAIAYRAYHASLGGREPPVIDGLTGDQRFFLSFAQTWRVKVRPEQALVALKSDPHSPAEFRVLGTVVNQPAFYTAFGIKEGDKMYRPPGERIVIW